MPGYDGTGPSGMGPMTGGGRGYCALPAGGYARFSRMGRFFGRLGGRGRRNRYYQTGEAVWQRYGRTQEDERAFLIEEAELLKQEISAIQNRISELEKDKK